jgi:spermidine dehydrogenase
MATKSTRKNGRGGDLGEWRRIPRRDFLQGALVASATALCGPLLKAHGSDEAAGLGAAQDLAGYYPPLLTGMRGSHPGSFESAHALRNQAQPLSARDSGEHYDLVVVGGGISGLSAAYFYRARTSPDARILILDNHDDFGGHAKRNEFQLAGRMHLLNGGTLEIQSPRPYSDVAEGLIRALGIDVEALSKKIERPQFYRNLGLGAGVFFDRETFGVDKLVVGEASNPKTRSRYPLPDRAKADIERIESGAIDFMPGVSSSEKKLRLSRMSYEDFLRNVVKVDPAAILFYQARTKGWWGVGIDAVSALDCWAIDLPGFGGMNLEPGSISRMGYTARGFADTGGSKSLHFPDGNATIARLLVRSLMPGAVPGSTAEDSVTARVAYDKLDRRGSQVRLRLNSTVVRATNSGSSGVEATYVRDRKAQVVRARHCVLACYNMMIPYLCPELPSAQKDALHKVIKTPLVYTSVALRNWQAFHKLGAYRVYAPGSYHTYLTLNPKVEVGSYHASETPSEPILLHMVRTPCQAGLPELEQNKVGRAELLSTSFATFEHNIRDQLSRVLGSGGFDPAHDIEAITVNRWPHGYAPEWNPLFAPDIPDAQRPNVLGRAQVGRITIANSDAGAAAYTDSAIDQADRAVNELLRT